MTTATAQTIQEAAASTGWSPRMLRYVEQLGLVTAPRSAGGYRLYGPAELQRLRTLRELIERHRLELGDIGFAARLRREPALAAALEGWFSTAPAAGPAAGELLPADPLPAAPPVDWLDYDQDKHQQLLRAGTRTPDPRTPDVRTPDLDPPTRQGHP